MYAAAKVAHWNVRGENFVGLHDLFGKVADVASDHEDAIAELIPQLGALVEPPGDMPTVNGAPDGEALCKSLADIIRDVVGTLTDATDTINELGDLDTVQTLSEATIALKKYGWQVLAHVETEEKKS